MSGVDAQGWLPPPGLLPSETWGASDLQPRPATALLGTGSPRAEVRGGGAHGRGQLSSPSGLSAGSS